MTSSANPRDLDCEAIEPLLAPYGEPDNEAQLTEAERAQLAAHFAACPPCRQSAESCRAARLAIRAHLGDLTASAPPLLAARCRALAARESRPRVGHWLGWSAAAAAVALTLIVVLLPARALATQLAADHVKCTRFGVSTALTGSSVELERAWADGGKPPIVIPAGAGRADLRLVGLRRCLTSEGVTAHVLYARGDEMLSLFILDGETPLARREVEAAGHREVLWTSGPSTYVLVGKQADLGEMAADMAEEIASR